MNLKLLAWAAAALAVALSSSAACHFRSKYLEAKRQLEQAAVQAETQQSILHTQYLEAVAEYETKSADDAESIKSLRAQLKRLQRSAASVRGGSAGAASSGSDGAGPEPDLLGAFLEGAELASEGAELARKEHTALTACVDMYNRASGK